MLEINNEDVRLVALNGGRESRRTDFARAFAVAERIASLFS